MVDGDRAGELTAREIRAGCDYCDEAGGVKI